MEYLRLHGSVRSLWDSQAMSFVSEAEHGHQFSAADLSPRVIERATAKATEIG